MLSESVHEGKGTILIGDINVNYAIKTNNKELKLIIKRHGMKQLITKPTRITKETSTLIDIIATTHEQNI